jgi:hypothetical protein
MTADQPLIAVGDDDLRDLRARLRATRWPSPWPLDAWQAGADSGELRRLVEYLATEYDWAHPRGGTERPALPHRRHRGRTRPLPSLRREHPGALPIVLTHG